MPGSVAAGVRGTSFTPSAGSNASENFAEQWPHSQKKIVLRAGGLASNLYNFPFRRYSNGTWQWGFAQLEIKKALLDPVGGRGRIRNRGLHGF